MLFIEQLISFFFLSFFLSLAHCARAWQWASLDPGLCSTVAEADLQSNLS